jgi:hypothetical protein
MMQKLQILSDGDQRSPEALRKNSDQKPAVTFENLQNLASSFFTQHHATRFATPFERAV